MDTAALELLAREYPELDRGVVEATLKAHNSDVERAREALAELSSQAAPQHSRAQLLEQQQPGSPTSPNSWLSWLGLSTSSPRADGGAGGGGWNVGLEDLSAGLGRVGSSMAQGLRSAAHTLGALIPAELNPFAEEEYACVDEGPDGRQRDRGASVLASPSLKQRTPSNANSSMHLMSGDSTHLASPRSPLSDRVEDLGSPVAAMAAKKWE